MIWGKEFQKRRAANIFPFDKVPIIFVSDKTIAQSGSIARYAAKLANCYPSDPVECAFSDSIFELAQEMCTINPLINCMIGQQFLQVKQWYFQQWPNHMEHLTRQLESRSEFFGGDSCTFADFNVFHMINNAITIEKDCIDDYESIKKWYKTMENLSGLKDYLANRPRLEGIGTNPGLVDKSGTRVSQMENPEGVCQLVDDCFVFHKD